MSLVLNSSGGGSVTIQEPTTASNVTQTLVAATGTLAPLISETAKSATGTSVEFTGIPSWVRRITVLFSGVSTNGTSNLLVQIGSGSFTTSGYAASGSALLSTPAGNTYTAGFGIATASQANVFSGLIGIAAVANNLWCCSYTLGGTNAAQAFFGGGNVTLSGALDRVRIATVNGTDTFDAGTINILYE